MNTNMDKNGDMNKGMNMDKSHHSCPANGHCCECSGCNTQSYGMCMHGGMRRYWRRHFAVLVIGVILAFWVGMRLGEIKGYMMSTGYGYFPMHHGSMMNGMQDDSMQNNAMPNNGTAMPVQAPSTPVTQ